MGILGCLGGGVHSAKYSLYLENIPNFRINPTFNKSSEISYCMINLHVNHNRKVGGYIIRTSL